MNKARIQSLLGEYEYILRTIVEAEIEFLLLLHKPRYTHTFFSVSTLSNDFTS